VEEVREGNLLEEEVNGKEKREKQIISRVKIN
jgi:hypothetical protein